MRALALTLTALIAAGCSGKSDGGEKGTPAEHHGALQLAPGNPALDFIRIEPVEESEAATSVTLTGRVTFDEDHTQRLASPIDGRATAILVHNGDKVRAGQTLVELTSPQVGQLQADAQKAQQDLSVAQKAIDRTRKLREDGAVSDKEVAQAEADFKKAKADTARTSAQLRALGLSASEPATTISLRAQIAGTVVERNVLVGQEVRADAAQPLLTVSSLDTVWVLADVYEQDLGLVQNGAKVTVHVPAYPGEGFDGTVGHVGDVVDPNTRTVKIRCLVPNPAGRLKPEMFAKVDVGAAAGRKVITIPTKAVLNDGDQTRVIVAAGNLFQARTVDVGPEANGRVRVLGGLKPGEKIVTDGAIFLKNEIDQH